MYRWDSITYFYSLLRTGPPLCDVALTFVSSSTTITAMWTVSSCEGAFPTSFEVCWNSTVADDRGTSGNLSGVSWHVITGLSSGTVYTITLALSDDCGTGTIVISNVMLSRG